MEPLSLLQSTRPDPAREETLVSQIYADLRGGMTSGAIATGTRLPSSRRAAEVLGISRNTVTHTFGNDIALHSPDGDLQLALIFKAGQDEGTALAALHEAGFSPGRLSALCLRAERLVW